jgi:CheY-like chemotaxis protein
MHGGTIDATSAGVGKGATFTVRLPSVLAAESERRSSSAEPALRGMFGSTADVADLHGTRVLAVDDEPDALALITEILESAGAQVTVAHSATEALGAIQLECPDVLIADLGMPRVDGFELIARIRQSSDPAIQRIPAVALTAYARSEDRARAIRSGFQIHLAKPIDPSILLDTIAKLTGGDPTNAR